MKKNTTFEVCPFCEEEVELNAELMVQTCPHCGKRIVACSMCRASEDTEHNYCTHCCLDYQARVENQENDWRYKGYLISFEPKHDGIMATAIRIADGKDLGVCVYGADEKDARLEIEDEIDTREMSDEPEVQPQAEDKPELAEKPQEPFIVMTREMSLLGETIQDITLSAWPIVWDNNKYDQDSREVLEMLRDWAVEFENWWYGHDQDWRDANCWSIEVEDYTIRKSKEYVKELQERISK